MCWNRKLFRCTCEHLHNMVFMYMLTMYRSICLPKVHQSSWRLYRDWWLCLKKRWAGKQLSSVRHSVALLSSDFLLPRVKSCFTPWLCFKLELWFLSFQQSTLPKYLQSQLHMQPLASFTLKFKMMASHGIQVYLTLPTALVGGVDIGDQWWHPPGCSSWNSKLFFSLKRASPQKRLLPSEGWRCREQSNRQRSQNG